MMWTLLLLVLGTSGAGAPVEPKPAPAAPRARPAAPKSKQKPGQKAKAKAPETAPAAEPVPLLTPAAPGVLKHLEEEPPVGSAPLPPDLKVPPVYRQPFVWDVPQVVDIIDVPGQMLADGIPVRLKAVRTKEKPEPLLQHMVERWMEWGLYVAPVEQQKQPLQEVMLTALDPERLITYTIILQPNPDGTTTLYLGEANMSKPPAVMSSVAPVFPGAEGVMTSDLEVVRSVNYSVRAKEAEVEAFYRTELGKAGFKEVKPRRFRSGNEELELILKPLQPGQLSVAVLRRTVAPESGRPTGD
jgi:hypothetical protein